MRSYASVKARQGFINAMGSFLSIAGGLVVGFLLLLAFKPQFSLYGFERIMVTGFSSWDKLAKVFYQSAPLLMTGLSVGFAFKTGLFNMRFRPVRFRFLLRPGGGD